MGGKSAADEFHIAIMRRNWQVSWGSSRMYSGKRYRL